MHEGHTWTAWLGRARFTSGSVAGIAGRLAAALAVAVPLTGCDGPFSTLQPAGPSAAAAALLWWGMFGFASLVLLAVVALWLFAMWRDPGEVDDAAAQRVQNRWIIGGGLVLPLASITVLLAFGIPAGHGMLPLPPAEGDALRIEVTARKWQWTVHYPDSDITLHNAVHIPAGEPVDLHLTSEDVIHSFWVPRLAGKLDMLPGRTNVLRLQADEPGSYRGQCAEFCGIGHAHMHFTVEVHAAQAFETWLQQGGTER